MKRETQRNWEEIRLKFIESNLSTGDFAKENDIPFGTLARQVRLGKWLEEREQYNQAVFHKTALINIDEKAQKLAKVDENFVDLSEDILDKVREILPTVDSAMALKSIAGTVKDIQAVMRLSLGASTENKATQIVQDFSEWLTDFKDEQRSGK